MTSNIDIKIENFNNDVIKNTITNILYERINKDKKIKYDYHIYKIFNSIENINKLTHEDLIDKINIYYNRNKLKKVLISLDQSLYVKKNTIKNAFMYYIKNSKTEINLHNKSEDEIVDILINSIENNEPMYDRRLNQTKDKNCCCSSKLGLVCLIFVLIVYVIIGYYVAKYYNTITYATKIKKP